jgi:hypothetical protein
VGIAHTEGARILALCTHRSAEPRRQGHFHCVCGWTRPPCPKPLRRSLHTRGCKCAWCIWCAPRCATCHTSTCASVVADLKAIYSARSLAEAEFKVELKALEMGWTLSEQKPGRGGPDFCRVIPFRAFGHPASVIYITNATLVGHYDAVASVTRTHRIFPRRLKRSTRWSRLSMRKSAVARGRCRSTTGNLHSIVWLWMSRDAFRVHTHTDLFGQTRRRS